MDILAKLAKNVVTIVGTPSYTSGDHQWKGAADILNKNPTDNKIKEIYKYVCLYHIDIFINLI
jgi:hypothetical protein